MDKLIIGLVSNGKRGEDIALTFARQGYSIKIFEIDRQRAAEFIHKKRRTIEVKDFSGKVSDRKIEENKMHWVDDFKAIAGCDLYLETLKLDLIGKKAYINKIDGINTHKAPVISDTLLYLPSQLSEDLTDNSRFLAAYFWDIEYTGNSVELIYHQNTAIECMESVLKLLHNSGFIAFPTRECPGFVHNRIGLLGIQNLFRMYDQGVLTFEYFEKYIVSGRYKPYFMNLAMGTELKTEIYDLLPLFTLMNKEYGSRFYIPRFLSDPYNFETLESCIKKTPRVTTYLPPPGQEAADNIPFKNILITGMHNIYNNVMYALLKESRLHFESLNEGYFPRLQRYNEKLFQQISGSAVFMAAGKPDNIDLVIDFSLQPFGEKVQRVRELQGRFGNGVPILLNTPVYEISRIAEQALYPQMLFGMYTQKNYLANSELVCTRSMDQTVYTRLKLFLKKITGTIIETGDHPVRPLVIMIISKMLEAVRILEAGLAEMDAIEFLGVDRQVFKEIDLLGLDRLLFICDYLKDIYKDIFDPPITVINMVNLHKLGFETGEGFYKW